MFKLRFFKKANSVEQGFFKHLEGPVSPFNWVIHKDKISIPGQITISRTEDNVSVDITVKEESVLNDFYSPVGYVAVNLGWNKIQNLISNPNVLLFEIDRR